MNMFSMNKIFKTFIYSALTLGLTAGMTSCTDYLDKEADSGVGGDGVRQLHGTSKAM